MTQLRCIECAFYISLPWSLLPPACFEQRDEAPQQVWPSIRLALLGLAIAHIDTLLGLQTHAA